MEFGIYKNLQVLNKTTDKTIKIKEVEGFAYASELRSCVVTISEFFATAKSLPIVFTKTDETANAMALMGLKEEKNLLIDSKGKWAEGEYIPAFVRRYPFIFVKDGDTLALAVDMDAPHVNKKNGKALLTKDGEMTDYAKSVMQFMEAYQLDDAKTQAFVSQLDALGLLESAKIDVKKDEVEFTLAGFFMVNEAKLNALSDADTLALVKSGAYKLVIAHLMSLTNMQKLLSLA